MNRPRARTACVCWWIGLWPRGLPKGRASVDLWLKDIGPSLALRKWFNRDPSRWAEFKRRYAGEHDALHASSAAVAALTGAVRCGKVTLLFGAPRRGANTRSRCINISRDKRFGRGKPRTCSR